MIKCFTTQRGTSEEIKKIIESNLLLSKEIKKITNFLTHLQIKERINVINTIKYYYNLVLMEKPDKAH